jgi:hypothetical protein
LAKNSRGVLPISAALVSVLPPDWDAGGNFGCAHGPPISMDVLVSITMMGNQPSWDLSGSAQLAMTFESSGIQHSIERKATTKAGSGTIFHQSEGKPSRIANSIGTNGEKTIRENWPISRPIEAKIGAPSTVFARTRTWLTILTNRSGTTTRIT